MSFFIKTSVGIDWTPYLSESFGSSSTLILTKTTFIGAMGLGIIALVPSLASYITNIKTLQGIGATSLIIMVGVALDLINQVRTHLLARNYESFLKE